MHKDRYHVLGVMSGTSLDGIDIAELDFSVSEKNEWTFKIIKAETIPYPDSWRRILKEAVYFSEGRLKTLNEEYTLYLSECISVFIKRHDIADLDAVCSHGHTILHRPEAGITLQIGNLPKLATLIGETVICDFRVQDVALGGQGAPLVPVGDQLLFNEYDYCLNLGGFANCSYGNDGTRIAYDICGVNIVLNHYATHLGKAYDHAGDLAASGILDIHLLSKLNALPFYDKTPPKSLGLEWVQENVFPVLKNSGQSTLNILRTYTEHIAIQLSRQFREHSSVFITGGGAYHDFLISRLKAISNMEIILPEKAIIEYKEALIFGLLGILKLRGEVNCLSSVTGAERDHSTGVIFHK
ncbi:anhydro-N-acetylmuramic acid kinase [Constantimarinum furrinae]|uniref:Anhydro-N-acetylmuramic acid kinase n=1 Tax=Constantimarinum furrinae TaxID=2562285 RepID=A0A7G8PUG5_9FLAO|nr:anhydro-N-acetylmuramic acid kinase [Constantimarinum furrinae]QNJ97981.1 anhydro-N-acetylmuramic acid kinase [Constantimarinum furrinae]